MSLLKGQSIWTLPEGIDDILPAEASRIELCRSHALALMKNWGYQLVYPPILEYLDSLLRGMDPELNLNTMKMVDQSSGRTVGVPADITPQIARIESFMNDRQISRICYAGPVLKANTSRHPGSRNPIQLGAELFGYRGPESDIEVISLLHDLLTKLEIDNPVIELSDMGLFRHLCRYASVNGPLENEILDALLRRDASDLQSILSSSSVNSSLRSKFEVLLELNGSLDVLDEAGETFKELPELSEGILTLKYVAEALLEINPKMDIRIDLSELRGYKYHSSISFMAHVEGLGRPLCWGGRYEYLSPRTGTFRPGTGFSTDLKSLSRISKLRGDHLHQNIVQAPPIRSDKLQQFINKLREDGYIVIQQLPGENFEPPAQSVIVQKEDGGWTLRNAK